jgi:hypothetical protein
MEKIKIPEDVEVYITINGSGHINASQVNIAALSDVNIGTVHMMWSKEGDTDNEAALNFAVHNNIGYYAKSLDDIHLGYSQIHCSTTRFMEVFDWRSLPYQ